MYENDWPINLDASELPESLIVSLAAPVLWPEHKTSGIYFLLDNTEIVYIGRSRNLSYRLFQHSKSEKIYNRYFYIFCQEKILNRAETYFIRLYRPKYNIQIPKGEK